MKISFITTVFNEEKTVRQFLKSLNAQTRQPDEIIVVDGGSTDKTLSVISNIKSIRQAQDKYPILNIQVKVFRKRGNRSVGRNEAIKKATGDIIVCSDSGNVLDKRWVEEITRPFLPSLTSPQPSPKRRGSFVSGVDVVAGYYKGLATNIFQKCLIPYVLVMPDKVDANKFLPATRSIAFTKKIWKKVGGFDEEYSHNEDYVFANKLKKAGVKIVFAKDAIVNWIPRNTYKEAFIMFFRFALGDAEAKIVRLKVMALVVRYLVGVGLLVSAYYLQSNVLLLFLGIALVTYIILSIKKNYIYINDHRAMIILPILQFTADIAVMTGTFIGLLKNFSTKEIFRMYLILYIFLILSFVFTKDNTLGKYFNFLLLIVAFFPILLILVTHKYKILFLQVTGVFVIFGFCMLLSFKALRATFPIPEINVEKIVGYTQYFGYPFYFDTIIFFLFLSVPTMAFYLLYRKSQQIK